MSEKSGHRDALYLFACHLEWRTKRNLAAYQELIAALDDQDVDIRCLAEVVSQRPLRLEKRVASYLQFFEQVHMSSPSLNTRVQSLVAEYGVFWQFWPQFEQTNGERRLVGFEVELIGSHKSDLKHVDPACPRCQNVRAVLLSIASLVPADLAIGVNSLTYNIDSHSGAILCLPNLGNRSAVWVSIYVFWNRSNGESFETDLLSELRTLLNKWEIHQR